jgi:hypothetical protein
VQSCIIFVERLEVDHIQDVLKRLNAISDSVPFHSEFLQKLMEIYVIAKEQEEKSDTTENGDNERKHLSYAENSNGEILQNSTEHKTSDVLSLENCADDTVAVSDFQENVKNPKRTLDIDNDENSTNHVEKEISLEV